MKKEWNGFREGKWTEKIDVRDFIQKNYHQYSGDESFLEGTTEKTDHIWHKCKELLKEELEKHVLDVDVVHMSGINMFKPGYINMYDDVIVGLQTDKPLKRIVNPFGGIRMVYQELDAYGYKLAPTVDKYFNQ